MQAFFLGETAEFQVFAINLPQRKTGDLAPTRRSVTLASITKRGHYWRAQIIRRGYPPQYRTFDSRSEAEPWSRAVASEMDRGSFVSRVESEKTTLIASEFTGAVLDRGCQLSMDGRGAWRDNVFVERLRRSVKYGRVYLKAYDSVSAARADISDYIGWYNGHRCHSSLADLTPDEHYFSHLSAIALAA